MCHSSRTDAGLKEAGVGGENLPGLASTPVGMAQDMEQMGFGGWDRARTRFKGEYC